MAALPPDVAADLGPEIALFPQPLADLRDRRVDPVRPKDRTRPEGDERRLQACRGGLRAPEGNGVDEQVPRQGEDEVDAVLPGLQHTDVGEQAGGEDLFDGLVDETWRVKITGFDGDEVEEARLSRSAVHLDGNPGDDGGRVLPDLDGARPGHREEQDEGRQNARPPDAEAAARGPRSVSGT
jgi:hypothetical protein